MFKEGTNISITYLLPNKSKVLVDNLVMCLYTNHNKTIVNSNISTQPTVSTEGSITFNINNTEKGCFKTLLKSEEETGDIRGFIVYNADIDFITEINSNLLV